jgi:hypothetical protein
MEVMKSQDRNATGFKIQIQTKSKPTTNTASKIFAIEECARFCDRYIKSKKVLAGCLLKIF